MLLFYCNNTTSIESVFWMKAVKSKKPKWPFFISLSTPPCWPTSQEKIKALGNATAYDTCIIACKSNISLSLTWTKKWRKRPKRPKTLTGYLRMIFFTWRRNALSPPKYLDFCIFMKSTNFKICDVIIDIAAKCELHFCLIFNRKYYRNEIWPNTSVSYKKEF